MAKVNRTKQWKLLLSNKKDETSRITERPEKPVFRAARSRCCNPKHPLFHHYGGRGIEFRFSSFEQFIDCVGDRPTSKHQLDRTDNDGHYEPGNVRWVLPSVNRRNCRNTIHLCYMGIDRPLADWADLMGVRLSMLASRYKSGWHAEDILFGKENASKRRPRQRTPQTRARQSLRSRPPKGGLPRLWWRDAPSDRV